MIKQELFLHVMKIAKFSSQFSSQVFEQMKNATGGAAGGTGPTPTNGGPNNNGETPSGKEKVVDADYTVIDDDKKK